MAIPAPAMPKMNVEAALHKADQRLSLLDALGAALVGVDAAGRTIIWTGRAKSLFGWSADEVLGQVPPIVPMPLLQEWQLQMQRVLSAGEPTPAAETQRVDRDGRIVPVVRTTAPLRGADGKIVGVLDTLMDITLLKQLDDESRALAQVRERELIAMDLHDGLVQGLYGVMLALDATRRTLEPPHPTAEGAMGAARSELERLIEESRSYLFDLRSRHYTPRDLGSGLRILADGLRLNGNLSVSLVLAPDVEQLLQPEVRGHLVYLAREAASNVLRHARARSVHIVVARSESLIELTVVDDGVGFSVPKRPARGHHGMRNMAERARLVGGRLDVSSARGRGTQIRVTLPIYRAEMG
jgi:PAS domain S-box-containing protein